MLCIVDEAGRLWVAGCSEQERGWVPRVELESWLCLMHEVAWLRLPLSFGRAHANLTLTENVAVATKGVFDGSWRRTQLTATIRKLQWLHSSSRTQLKPSLPKM